MTRTDRNSQLLSPETSINLDAMDMDMDLLDDLELDELEFDTPFEQTIYDEDASYKTKGSSKISNYSAGSSERIRVSKKEGKRSKRKFEIGEGQHDGETSLVRKKPKRTCKKVKRYDDSDFDKRKKDGQSNKSTPQGAIGNKDDRRAQDPLSKDDDVGVPTILNVLKQYTAQRKVSRELVMPKPTSSVSNDSIDIKNIMPPAQAALFESLSKASNQAGSFDEPPNQALTSLQQQQYMSHFLAQQRNSQYSLMYKMPITLPFAVDEFFPLAQTHVKDNEPLNKLFPSIFKIFSKSSARYNPNIPSSQHPLLNLVYNKIGTKIELIPKGDIPLNSKPQRVHLGIDKESIHTGIDCIRDINRKTLTADLNRLLGKINRQKNFLMKQMNQISRWYTTNVEDKDSTSSSSMDRKRIHSSLALSLGVSKDLVHNFIESNDPKLLLISVKVKCNGLTAPHSNNIDAIIYPSRELNPALRAIGIPIPTPEPQIASQKLIHSGQKAKNKARNHDPSADESVTVTSMKVGHKQKPVTEMVFADRRVMFKKTLAERISQFTNEIKTSNGKIEHILEKRNKDIQDILQKNGDECMDSLTYFNLVKLVSGWDNYTKEEVEFQLNTLYQPELPQREVFWRQLPTPIINTQDELNKRDPASGQDQKSTSSLFSRLQSLLVEEDVPGEENADIDDINTLPDDIVDDIEELKNEDDHSDSTLLDVSSLSLDQRAYIQLRAAHLIDQPLLHSSQPQVKENAGNMQQPRLDIDASINVAIRRKQKQLSEMNAVNNRKLDMLKELALAEISDNCKEQIRNINVQSIVDPIRVGHAVPRKFVHK